MNWMKEKKNKREKEKNPKWVWDKKKNQIYSYTPL